METKELLEQLVKEVAAQNKLIALLLAKGMGIPNWDFLNKGEQIERLKDESCYFLDLVSK